MKEDNQSQQGKISKKSLVFEQPADTFNLSSERRNLFIEEERKKGFPVLPSLFARIEEQDREFIKRLKGLHDKDKLVDWELVLEEIDELAGDKLI